LDQSPFKLTNPIPCDGTDTNKVALWVLNLAYLQANLLLLPATITCGISYITK